MIFNVAPRENVGPNSSLPKSKAGSEGENPVLSHLRSLSLEDTEL